MAKGKNDLILRDRMQFTFTGDDIPTLYGRVDLSDYVSIPKSEGLKIKEIRFKPHMQPILEKDKLLMHKYLII